MSEIVNTREIGGFSGCCRATFVAENLTTGISSIFSIKLSVPDKGLSYVIDYLRGRVPETAPYNVCDGKVGGLIPGGNTYDAKSLDLTFGDEYNYNQSIHPTIARNLLISAFLGGRFDFGGNRYTLLGTNGTRNIGSYSRNNDFKYLFTKEGEVIEPDLKDLKGNMSTSTNTFIGAYSKNNPIVMEFLYATELNETKGDRFVYVLPSSITFQEGSGTDYNKYSANTMRYCDYREIGSYLINGLTNPETMQTSGTDEIFIVNADIVIEVSGGGIPTVAGTAGQQAVVIDSDDNTVEMYLHDGTDWGTTAPAVTSTLGQGALIYTRLIDTALDGSTSVAQNSLIGIKTAGTTGNAVAVDSKTGVSGSGASTCIWKFYDWSYRNEDFALAVGDIA